MSKDEMKPAEGDDADSETAMSGEFYRQIFHVATAAAAGVLVLLVGFLGANWSDKAAARLTLNSIGICAGALMPYVIVSVMLAFKGQVNRYSRAWLLNYHQSLAALLILILGFLGAGLGTWFAGLRVTQQRG